MGKKSGNKTPRRGPNMHRKNHSVLDLTDFNGRRIIRYAVEVPLGQNVGETRIVGLSHSGFVDTGHDVALDGVTAFLASFNSCRLLQVIVHFDLRMQPGSNSRTGAFLLPGQPSNWDTGSEMPANWVGAATPQTSTVRQVKLDIGPEFDCGRFVDSDQVSVTDSLLLTSRGFGGNARVILVVEVVGIPQLLHQHLFAPLRPKGDPDGFEHVGEASGQKTRAE